MGSRISVFVCLFVFTSGRSWSQLQYSLPLELGRSVEGLDGGVMGRKTVVSASQAFRTRAGPLAKLDLGLQGRDLCLNDSFVSVLFSLPVNPWNPSQGLHMIWRWEPFCNNHDVLGLLFLWEHYHGSVLSRRSSLFRSVTREYAPQFFVSSQQRFGMTDIKAPSACHRSRVLDRPCYSSQVTKGLCYSS